MLVSFFFSSRRRHTRCGRDWSSDVCSSDLSSSAQLARHISQRIAEGQVALRDLHTQCGIGFTVDLAHRFSSKLDRPRIDAQLGSNETDVIVAIVQAALSNGVTVNVFTHVTTQFATERVALYQATPCALSFGRVAQRRIGVTIDLALIMGCYRDRAWRDAEGLVVCIEGDAVVTRFRALAEKYVIAANISAPSAAQRAGNISQGITHSVRTQAATGDPDTQRGIGFTVDLAHQISSKRDRPRIDAQLGSNETDVIVAIVQAALSNGVT